MTDIIAFNRGIPAPESFPVEQMVACTSAVLREDGDVILQYGNSSGYPALVHWLATRYEVEEDHVITGQGSLQLLDFLVKTHIRKKDIVFVEQPTYDRVLTIFQRAGVQLIGFPLVNGRLNFDDIKTILRQGKIPKFFYVIADFQNPGGTCMPHADRKELVRLAAEYHFTIIEDGPYRELRYQGQTISSMYEMDSGVVILMSSFSKLISPGIRVGYMIASKAIIEKMWEYANNTYISSVFLTQAAAFEFVRRGWMASHLEQLKRMYSQRWKTILEVLDIYLSERATWFVPDGGYFVGIFLNHDIALPSKDQINKAGLHLSDGRAFFLQGGEQFIRLPFCALSPDLLEEGIKRIESILVQS